MTAHDPAEIVRDFVVKRSKLFPGGVFWYNCSTPELLEASVTSVKKTLPHLKTIKKDPPKQPKRIDRKESMDPVPLFVEHYRLIILDSPFSLEECTRAIPDMKDQEVDIVIIDNMEANRDRKLSDFADSVLIRGCATIEVSDIDRYTSIQRMAYRLLCEQDFCPYEEDYEAFETIVSFCRGSSVLVKVFEGLLTSKEKGVLQSIAKDIAQVKEIVISYGDTHTSPLQQASLPSSHQSVSLASSLSSFQREVGKKVGRLGKKAKETKLTPAKNGLVESHNGLITADLAKRLSNEDIVLLSEGIEKVPRVMDSFCNFLPLRLSPEAHFLLQFLSYISGYPNVDSEGPFVFPESFVNHLSTIVANSTQSFSSSALVGELRRMNLILLYPQPVLSPPERAADENLLYIPDIIVRVATYDIDETDIAFILNISSAIITPTNGILSPVFLKPIQSRISKLTECQRLK